MDRRTLPAASVGLDERGASGARLEPCPTFEFSGVHNGLRRLQLWVAINGALHLTLRQAAQIACLEPHYLSRAFRRRVGQTFLEWTREYRISRAVLAIESRRYSIDEVTRLVGYRDRRSLERVVKSVTGKTPAALQKRSATVSAGSDLKDN